MCTLGESSLRLYVFLKKKEFYHSWFANRDFGLITTWFSIPISKYGLHSSEFRETNTVPHFQLLAFLFANTQLLALSRGRISVHGSQELRQQDSPL